MRVLLLMVLMILVSCSEKDTKVYEKFPINSSLTFGILEKSERLIVDENYFVIQVNLKKGTEYYEPYLLFYKKNLKLEFAQYNPGKVISIKDSIVKGNFNEYRSESSRFRLKNNYSFNFNEKSPVDSRSNFCGKAKSFFIIKDSFAFRLEKNKIANNQNNKIVKFHLNEIVFSTFDENNIEIHSYSKDKIVYNDFKLFDSLRIKLKKEMWKYVLINKT